MNVIFLLPWVPYIEPTIVGDITLHPYKRGIAPGDASGYSQSILDAVLGNYGELTFKKRMNFSQIQEATIVTWSGDGNRTSLDDSEIRARLQEGDLLTFSALSKRDYRMSMGYYNADTSTMIAQRFDPTRPAHTEITTRRRNGTASNFIAMTPDAPIFIRPGHIEGKAKIEIDIQLIEAVLATSDKKTRTRLSDSIALFNRANTDGSGITLSSEIVMLRSAYEILLDCGHGVEEFRAALNELLKGKLISPSFSNESRSFGAKWLNRWPATKNRSIYRPLDCWAHDFCHARNAGAHGAHGKKGPSVWTIENHLLYASWLFPLLVKVMLEKSGALSISDADNDLIRECEQFFGEDILRQNEDGQLKWSIIQSAILEAEIERSLSHFFSEDRA